MTYITGTMPADGNAAAAFYALLEPAILAAGITLEDTVVIGARTYKVFRSLNTNTTVNTTWWMAIHYTTTGAGNLGILTFEDWNSTTNLMFRKAEVSSHPSWAATPSAANLYAVASLSGAAGTTGAALDATGNSTYTNPYTAGGTGYANRSLSMPTGTTIGYWASVTGDRLALVTSPTPNTILATGVYTPHADQVTKFGANVVPIYSLGFDTTTSTPDSVTVLSSSSAMISMLLTRAPGVIGTTEDHFASLRAERLGVALTPYPDPTSYVEAATARRPEIRYTGYYSGTYGYLTGMKVFRNNIANITRGDTITIDGVSHFLASTPQGAETLAIAAV